MKRCLIAIIGLMLLVGCFTVSSAWAQERESSRKELLCQQIRFPTTADKVEIIKALPIGESGVEIKIKPTFTTTTANTENGFVTLEISAEPVWMVEGDLPKTKNLKLEDSPFGFHSGSIHQKNYNYDYAIDIGVVWDRACDHYMLWYIGQPDIDKPQYNWKTFEFDPYFRNLPDGMMPLKNLTVIHDKMVRRPGRAETLALAPEGFKDTSRYLDIEGMTFRPRDPEEYSRWVKAVVERYDGDGIDDMPGLRIPAKYWQVDNEPPRGREGYADLVKITSKAIKEADPEAKVLIGGLVESYGSRKKEHKEEIMPILKELGGKYIDIIDVHWYGSVGVWKILPQAIRNIRKDMVECGFKNNIPIWFTELGTYSGNPRNRRNREIPYQSERQQAAEMVKRHAVLIGKGVKKVFWALGMIEGFNDPNDNDYFDNTGFVYDGIGPDDPGRGVKKIIYWSYQKMTQLLQYWDGNQVEKIDAGKGVVAYRFRFDKGNKRGIVVAWLDEPSG